MALLPEDVLNKLFTASQFRRGYDEREVDEFLDEIVVELRRLGNANDDLRLRLDACHEGNGVIPPQAQEEIAAAGLSAEQAEQAEQDAAAGIGQSDGGHRRIL
jgi:DivIVA domain-containing protein